MLNLKELQSKFSKKIAKSDSPHDSELVRTAEAVVATSFKAAKFSNLLLAATSFHIILGLCIFFAGKYKITPEIFDERGIGLTFAADSAAHHGRILHLAEFLRGGFWSAWWHYPAELHHKVYSLSFAAFSGVCGDSLICAEPVNLIFYLFLVSAVYLLGSRLFTARAGFAAAAICAVFPSLVLHTTQVLRDPLFICAMLVLIISLVALVQRQFSLRANLAIGAAGALAALVLWQTRGNHWEIVALVLILGAAAFFAAVWLTGKWATPNYLGLVIVCAAALLTPALTTTRRMMPKTPSANAEASPSEWSVVNRVIAVRRRFQNAYAGGGTTLDAEVKLETTGDLIAYSPRALAIGLFAPFPWMFFETGKQSGLSARLLSGAETLFIYLMQLLAVLTVWRNRRKPEIWFLAATVLAVALVLGLVIPNVGAIYRMRYFVWILIVVLAAESLVFQVNRVRRVRET